MKSLVKKLTLAILLIGLFMGIVVPVLAQESTPPIPPESQQEKERLLTEYEAALEFELKYGETAINPEDGTIVLIGESAAKMDSLWQKTVRQIEDAIARPPESRVATENRIAAIDGNYPEYVSRAVFIYNPSIAIEKYQTEKYFYTVDIASGQILEIMPIDSTRFRREFDDKETVYSQDALEKMALTLISAVSEDVDISSLQPIFSDKNERNYFFRWENSASKLPDGMPSFIQVGLSAKGELLNYVNTLSAGIKHREDLFATNWRIPNICIGILQ